MSLTKVGVHTQWLLGPVRSNSSSVWPLLSPFPCNVHPGSALLKKGHAASWMPFWIPWVWYWFRDKVRSHLTAQSVVFAAFPPCILVCFLSRVPCTESAVKQVGANQIGQTARNDRCIPEYLCHHFLSGFGNVGDWADLGPLLTYLLRREVQGLYPWRCDVLAVSNYTCSWFCPLSL